MKLKNILNNIILEGSIKNIEPIYNLSDEEKKNSYLKLSETELNQLHNEEYIPYDLWPTFRNFLVKRSIAGNKQLNPDFTAYTPGETLHLLNNSVISNWLSLIKNYKVPDNFNKIIFVPCAKTKPWENATRGIYKDYNKLKNDNKNIFFVTISEPLAIVPQTFWSNFPQYDNPGLFKDSVLRSGGLFKSDFKKYFGLNKIYKIPFDTDAYNMCIDKLSNVIQIFIKNNRDKDMISFVEDFKGISTHSDMLTRAGFTGKRLLKRNVPRKGPYDYIKKSIQ